MTTYVLGQPVPLAYAVTDDAGEATSPATAVLTITKPDGTTVTPTITEDPATVGLFTLDYLPATVGPYAAVFVTTGPPGAQASAFLVADGGLPPLTLADVKAYLGDTSTPDAEISKALAVERSAQADRCRLDPTSLALREALLRRVARNLAARAVPVTAFSSFDGGGTVTRVPTSDPEIARLEGPFRRKAVG